MKSVNTKPMHHKMLGRLGSATLEMALTLIILVNVTYGTIEFGQYFYVKNQFQGAAREGARAGVPQGATTSDVTSAVTAVMNAAGISSSAYTVTSTNVTGTTGSQVTVTVSGTWSNLSIKYRPYSLIGSAKVVTGSAVMRKE